MKKASLFQLGGIAVLLSAILTGLGRLIYFLSGQPDLPFTPDLWRGIFAGALMVIGLGALFARQSQQGGVLSLIGYIFLVCATIFFIASDAVDLGVAAGLVSYEEIAQVPSYTLSSSIMSWVWVAGLLAFGISIYRAQVFSKFAGVLLLLLASVQPLTGLLAFTRPVYAFAISLPGHGSAGRSTPMPVCRKMNSKLPVKARPLMRVIRKNKPSADRTSPLAAIRFIRCRFYTCRG